MSLTRRGALQLLLAAGVLPRSLVRAQGKTRLKLAPVGVSRERVVRTIVGLRPFRPSGFVVRADKLGDQTIVHNYGHGGAGVTLSWGSAQLAVDEAVRGGDQRFAVLGCGAVGLATARLLQKRGLEAIIYARDLPPATTSNVAGARWYPFDVFDRSYATPEFMTRLWRAARISLDHFKHMMGDRYGIYWRPTYACRNSPFPEFSLLNFDSPIHDLLPGLRDLTPAENPFPYSLVREFQTLMIEPGIYLPAVMADYRAAKGRIVVREFKTPADVAALEERVVINCTGLGAGTLFGDSEMFPIKGQLTILPPQPEVGYITLPPDLYMFPRKDGIVLGGTFERRVATLEPNLVAEERVLTGHARFFSSLKSPGLLK